MDQQRSEEQKRREEEEREIKSKENEVGSEEWKANQMRIASETSEGNMSGMNYSQMKDRLEQNVKKSNQDLLQHMNNQFKKHKDIRGYMKKLNVLTQEKNQAEFQYVSHIRSRPNS